VSRRKFAAVERLLMDWTALRRVVSEDSDACGIATRTEGIRRYCTGSGRHPHDQVCESVGVKPNRLTSQT
jgi:hypothetical protein